MPVGMYQAGQEKNQGGYVASRFNLSGAQAAPMSDTQSFQLQDQLNIKEDHWAVQLAGYVAAAPVEVVDSMAAIFPGVEKGQVSDAAYDAVGLGSFGAWRRRHAEGVEVAGGIAGAVAVGIGAEVGMAKLLGSAWFGATSVGRAATPIVQMAARAQQAASESALLAAQSGTTLRWYESMTTAGQAVRFGSGSALNVGITSTLSGAAKAGVSELAIAAILNKNKAVWSDDMTQNMIFAGLGLGIGGTVAGIQARAAMRRWANSPEVMGAHMSVRDPKGYERQLGNIPVDSVSQLTRNPAIVPKQTTMFSNQMLNAQADEGVELSVRTATKTQQEAEAYRTLQQITVRGTPALPNSGFSVAGTAEAATLKTAAEADPLLLYGAASVAKVDDGIGVIGMEKKLNAAIAAQEAIAKKGGKVADQATLDMKNRQMLVLVDGSWMPVSDAAPIAQYTPKRDLISPITPGVQERTWKLGSGKSMTIREDGVLSTSWDKLQIPEILEVADVSNQLMAGMLKNKTVLTLRKGAHFSEIDLAMEFEKRGGVVDYTKNAGFANMDEAAINALQQKSTMADKMKKLGTHERLRLNLPQVTALERISDPDGVGLRHILRGSKVPGATLVQIKDAKRTASKVFDLASDIKGADSLDGDIFNFNRASKKHGGGWMKPVVGFFDDTPATSWHHQKMGDELAERQVTKLMALRSSPKKAPAVARLTEVLINTPGRRDIENLAGLADDQVTGLGGAISSTAGQFLTKAMQIRDSATITAAAAMRSAVNRITEMHIDEALKRIGKEVDQISGTAGLKSRVLYDNYASSASGWDIAKVVDNGDGTVSFALQEDSIHNQQRLGRKVESGELMVANNGSGPVALDELANRYRYGIEAEYKAIANETNALRKAQGLEPMNIRNFWVPPQSTEGKLVGFTLDANNRPMPGGAIIADTEAEFAAQRAKLKLNPGERFMTQDMIKSEVDLWELRQMEFQDPTRLAATRGPSKGSLTQSRINPRSVQDGIAYIKRGHEQIANGTVRTVFDSQLKAARMHRAAESAARGQKAGAKSVWDIYEETMMGIPANAKSVGLSGIAQRVDEWMDGTIAAAWPSRNVSREYLQDVFAKAGSPKLGKVPKDMAGIADALGPHMPLASVTDWLEYKHGIEAPWKSKELARHVNRLGAGVILRWLEIPHAMLNIAGVITNMPGIVGAKNVPMVGKTGGVAVVDQMKIMARGTKRMLMEKSGADWDYMAMMGDTSQAFAEMHMQMAVTRGKTKFMRVMTGDPRIKYEHLSGKARAKAYLQHKGAEGMASIITDSSESMSRSWSHFIGLELADAHGITGMEARHQFARKIADDAIANYDPLNRPEIFQSAFGSMYGMFLSYAQNYYQRMFTWVEQAEYKAIAKTAVLQASAFGVTGVPGFQPLAQLMGGEEDGDHMLDRIYERFGPQVGSVLAHGGINEITTILNGPLAMAGIEGIPSIALHTRGDMNFRHPTLDAITTGGIPTPVGLEVLKDVIGGTMEILSKMIDPNVPMTGRHAAEIAARNMPSRALRGTIAVLAAGGQEADAYGNMMSETQGWAESLFRVLGVRSARQQGEIEAYFMNQRALQIDSQRLDKVRTTTRALIRDGQLDRLPEVFNDYVESGGKPWNYANWIRGMIQESTSTRGQNQLLKALKNPNQQVLANRIKLFTAPY